MIKFAVLVVSMSLVAGTAAAQSRVYAGGTVAIDSGSRGAYDTLGTSFPAAGGFIGFRFHDAWSMEVHGDRAFAESPERETVISIFERYAVRDRAGNGLAVLAVWKTRRQSRVGAAVTMGIEMRGFRTERVSDKKIRPERWVSRGRRRRPGRRGPRSHRPWRRLVARPGSPRQRRSVW